MCQQLVCSYLASKNVKAKKYIVKTAQHNNTDLFLKILLRNRDYQLKHVRLTFCWNLILVNFPLTVIQIFQKLAKLSYPLV